MFGLNLGLPGVVLRSSWSPRALPTAFLAGGFAPPPFSPALFQSAGAGFWINLKEARQ
ncbi:hypothetical protein [Falsigemmobacter faecalis]|uniref:hypothetical protein n=1 Tax=Falsigemmobacter faecalis TaxID=2488730 RepID=UPI0013151BCC|nr:hypothetical protein [Falsigemmobacter faecalis]